MENKWLKYGIALVAGIPVALCLSVVCCSTSSLSSDILADDWRWMYACGVLSSAAFALLIFLFPARIKECLSAVVSWVFILYGGMEAVWGIRQVVYGFTYSNHSLYALTGSFYNPGPYSGYLAMIFPICLYEWLKRKEGAAYTVSVNIESREYNGRWYTDIRAWRIQPKQAESAAPMPDMPPIPEEPSYASSPAEVDDLPF